MKKDTYKKCSQRFQSTNWFSVWGIRDVFEEQRDYWGGAQKGEWPWVWIACSREKAADPAHSSHRFQTKLKRWQMAEWCGAHALSFASFSSHVFQTLNYSLHSYMSWSSWCKVIVLLVICCLNLQISVKLSKAWEDKDGKRSRIDTDWTCFLAKTRSKIDIPINAEPV
jgi:hypothetical protein